MSNLPPDSQSLDKFSFSAQVIIAFLCMGAIAALYFLATGIVAIWPDSLLYAEPARNLVEAGQLAGVSAIPAPYPPLYSLFMALCFSIGSLFTADFYIQHQILIGLQLTLVCSTFFPLRSLLSRCDGVGRSEAIALSAVVALSATTLPYASILCAEALFIPLFIWFTCLYDNFLNDTKKNTALWCGILLAALVLTKEMGWVVYSAVALCALQRFLTKKSFANVWGILVLPLLCAGIWQAYLYFVLHQPFELPNWNLNNGLARFNFVKNGIVYLMYVGMPLAGLGFIIACFTQKASVWEKPFFHFAFITILGVLIYTALANTIIVDRKLDYITNRLIEPFVILPFIAFMRLPLQIRKETMANGMLIFFCMMIFGFPYAIKTDFITGLSYWAQSLTNPNLGIIRNAIYLLLISLPVIIIWWKPKFFILTYACVAAIITCGNLMQDQTVWSANEDGNFKYVNIFGFAASAAIKNAQAIYIDNQCAKNQNNNIAYLYRCNDLNKLLYFLPRTTQYKSAQDMNSLQLKPDENVLYASSDNDNAWGSVVANIGLGKLMRVGAKDIAALKPTPLVSIPTIEQSGRYINVRLNDGMQRVTLLAANNKFNILSDTQGCAEIHVSLANDGGTENQPKAKQVEFILNTKPIKKTMVGTLTTPHVPEAIVVPLDMREGENTLQIHYDEMPDANRTIQASLFMFGRPVFKPCK
jgi:hypothetical protein